MLHFGPKTTVGFAISLLTLGCNASLGGDPRETRVDAEPLNTAEGVEFPSEVKELTYGGIAARCDESKIGKPLLRRLGKEELTASIRTAFPDLEDWTPDALEADPKSELGFDTDSETLVASPGYIDAWARTAEELASQLTEGDALRQWTSCQDTSPCVEETLERIGAQLTRRPLLAEELSEFLEFFELVKGRSDERNAWRWTLAALLQHPSVLYRGEIGEKGENGTRSMRAHELADALAYTYTGAPPDEELRDLANAGELSDATARVEQAKRLLETPAGEEMLVRFVRQWLFTERVSGASKAEYEGFEAISRKMTEEADRLIRHVLIEEGGSLEDLFTVAETVVDPELAEFYGLPHEGDGWLTVSRDASEGVGILATGAVTAGFSQHDKSSPTQRGLFVFRRLLCKDIPPPPAELPAVEAPAEGGLTTRQLWERQHANQEACRVCHDEFDPVGYAFEHFDELGRYRADEDGLTIDATGSVEGADTHALDGLTDLGQALATDTALLDCATGFMNIWAFSGAKGETCLAEEARRAFASGELTLKEYFAALAGTQHFSQRKTQ